MKKTAAKTLTYSVMHLIVAFTVAYVLTRDWRAALAIGMVEPIFQTIAFAAHERAWALKPARVRTRHLGLVASFVLMVVLPGLVAAWYLYVRAADQYASTVGFSVRTEEASSAIELLGGITELSGSSSSDTDILYAYLQSQQLVAELEQDLGLSRIWSKAQGDPLFSYDPTGTIEDLVEHWDRKVSTFYDSATGIIEVRVLAYDPQDSLAIAQALFAKSQQMINELNAIAREDSLRYAREELERSVARLKDARRAMTAFRNENQIVDPNADMQTQVGLLGTLQAQLAAALIELDILNETTRPDDPRIDQAQRRVRVIEDRIAAERRKLGLGGTGEEGIDAFANLVGDYQALLVDLTFAEQSYQAAMASFDAAMAEARRQTRYLAAHVQPTLAESARYPQREVWLGVILGFIFLGWTIMVMIFYALKDRR
ncbi:MAG: DUF2061 domain-containing protein [Rhodobacterales bacterium]|nr:DUF2061 domain-containing protein [Rhodobacterales bacterium]